MESMTVPLTAICSGIIFWCIWLTREVYRSRTDIEVNSKNDEKVGEQIKDLKTDIDKRIDKFENHVGQQFDKVFMKIDQIAR